MHDPGRDAGRTSSVVHVAAKMAEIVTTSATAQSPAASLDLQVIGIALAIVGNLIISIALNLTKYAHNTRHGRHYTQLPLWWLGLAATIVGEVGNFAAYGFAEASLIAPLGAVSVLANAFIASLVLGEGLRMRDVIGCILCIGGATVIVCSTSSQSVDLDPTSFIASLQTMPFIIYIVVLCLAVGLMLGFQDKYGHRHVTYYVLLCSLIGSVTVMSCKGVSTFVSLWLISGTKSPFGQPVIYVLFVVLCTTAILQVRYLNEAMERFGNTETVPVYYVLFTLTTILGSNILYRDFENEDTGTIAFFCVGCLFTFAGVKLLTSRSGVAEDDWSNDKSMPLAASAHGTAGSDAVPAAVADKGEDPFFDEEALAAGEELLNARSFLLPSPGVASVDVLASTFTSQLAAFERAAVDGTVHSTSQKRNSTGNTSSSRSNRLSGARHQRSHSYPAVRPQRSTSI